MRRIWANKISALAMIACGTALSLTLSCSTAQPQFETPYKANVISFVPKTSATDESWTIETKDLATLEHPAKAQGKYFEIITGSSIKIDSTSGSLTVATNTNQDRTDLRLDSRNGVIVARDTASLYALSAFYSFELLFQQLEQVIPIDADKLFEENGGRLKVFLQPSLVERSNWSNAVVTPKMNAAFNPENNDFYLLKSSVLEKYLSRPIIRSSLMNLVIFFLRNHSTPDAWKSVKGKKMMTSSRERRINTSLVAGVLNTLSLESMRALLISSVTYSLALRTLWQMPLLMTSLKLKKRTALSRALRSPSISSPITTHAKDFFTASEHSLRALSIVLQKITRLNLNS